MDTKNLSELFYAFWDTGVILSFGKVCATNIPRNSDPNDTRVTPHVPKMGLFKGKMDFFNHIVEELVKGLVIGFGLGFFIGSILNYRIGKYREE